MTTFIETPPKTYKKQKQPKEKRDMTEEQFSKAKAEQKANIAKAKQDIKKAKLLMKQAKITFKLTKMKG